MPFKNLKVVHSTKNQDMKEHWDWKKPTQEQIKFH